MATKTKNGKAASGKTSPAKRTAAKKKTPAKTVKKDISASYNKFKEYKGKQYTGMAVGRTHTWNYDKGLWKEKKVTPDRWDISFKVIKRRKGRAPEGSGVPVGTQYHWYVLAHQYATKLNANDYTTEMHGIKLKIAHKRKDSEKWNISEATQQKHLIRFLKEYIQELEKGEAAPAGPVEPDKSRPGKRETEKANARIKTVKKPK